MIQSKLTCYKRPRTVATSTGSHHQPQQPRHQRTSAAAAAGSVGMRGAVNIGPSNNNKDDAALFRLGVVTHTNVPDHYAGFDAEAGSTWIYPTNFSKREYQFRICEQALFYNTLVSLPTGLGKTYIAAVIMYNFYRWYPKKKILFVAPTRPLVAQQMRACFEVMGVPQAHMAELTGATMLSCDRMAVWRDKRMFFLTPQVVKNDLQHMSVRPEEIVCIVFDEAHAAHGNYAYCTIIREMLLRTTQFRVLALTATPGKDREKIQEVLKNLLISRIDIRTNESLDIRQYTHTRRIVADVIKYDAQTQDFIDRFQGVINFYADRLKKLGAMPQHVPNYKLSPFLVLNFAKMFRAQGGGGKLNATAVNMCHADFSLLQSLTRTMESLRYYGLRPFWRNMVQFVQGERGSARVQKELETNPVLKKLQTDVQHALGIENNNMKQEQQQQQQSIAKKQTHAAYQRSLLNMSLGRPAAGAHNQTLVGSTQFNGDSPSADVVDNTTASFFVYGHPKMQRLEQIVVEHFRQCLREFQLQPVNANKTRDNTTRCIVFVQYRDSCAEIVSMLERHDPVVRVSMFVGQSSRLAHYNDDLCVNVDMEDAKNSGRVGQKQREQLAVIQKFRSGQLNTLVATCIGEEGLDVGEVDLIVCYDIQKSPVRMIQRMGRTGRKRDGRVVILLTEGLEEEKYKKANQTKDDAAIMLAKTSDYLYYHNCPRLVPRDIKPRCEEVQFQNREFKEIVKKTNSRRNDSDDDDDSSAKKKKPKMERLDEWLRRSTAGSGKKQLTNKPSSSGAAENDHLRLSAAQWLEYQSRFQCEHANAIKRPPETNRFGVNNVDGMGAINVEADDDADDSKLPTYTPITMPPIGQCSQDTQFLRLTAFDSVYQSDPTPTFALQRSSTCAAFVRVSKLLEQFRSLNDAADAEADDIGIDAESGNIDYGNDNIKTAAEVDCFLRGGYEALEAKHDNKIDSFAVNTYKRRRRVVKKLPSSTALCSAAMSFAATATVPAAAAVSDDAVDNSCIIVMPPLKPRANPDVITSDDCFADLDIDAVESQFYEAEEAAKKQQQQNELCAVIDDADTPVKNDIPNPDGDDDLFAELDMDAIEQKFNSNVVNKPQQQFNVVTGDDDIIPIKENFQFASPVPPPPPPPNVATAASRPTAVKLSATTVDETPPSFYTKQQQQQQRQQTENSSQVLSNSMFDDIFTSGSQPKKNSQPWIVSVTGSSSIQPNLEKSTNRMSNASQKSIGFPRHSSTPRHASMNSADGFDGDGDGDDNVDGGSIPNDMGISTTSCSAARIAADADAAALDLVSPIRAVSVATSDETQNSATKDDWWKDVQMDELEHNHHNYAASAPAPATAAAAAAAACRQRLNFEPAQNSPDEHNVISFSLLHELNSKPERTTATRFTGAAIPTNLSANSTNGISHPFNKLHLAHDSSKPMLTADTSPTTTTAATASVFRTPFLSPTCSYNVNRRSGQVLDAFSSGSGKITRQLQTFQPPQEARRNSSDDDKNLFKNWRTRPLSNGKTKQDFSNSTDDSPEIQRGGKRVNLKRLKSAAFFDEDGSPEILECKRLNVRQSSLPSPRKCNAVRSRAVVPSASANTAAAAGQRTRPPPPPRRRPRNDFILSQAEVSDDDNDHDHGMDETDIREQEDYDAEMNSFINNDAPTQTGIDTRTLYAQEIRRRDAGVTVDGFMNELRARNARSYQQNFSRPRYRAGGGSNYDANIYSQAPTEEDLANDTYDDGDGFIVKD